MFIITQIKLNKMYFFICFSTHNLQEQQFLHCTEYKKYYLVSGFKAHCMYNLRTRKEAKYNISSGHSKRMDRRKLKRHGNKRKTTKSSNNLQNNSQTTKYFSKYIYHTLGMYTFVRMR